MCAEEPTILSRSSPCKPVMSASAISSAITPTVTPRVEIREISEMNACFRRASRYRTATNSSKGREFNCQPPTSNYQNGTPPRCCLQHPIWRLEVGCWSLSSFRSHQRKQDDVPDRRAVGEEHDETIDADALAAGGRQTVFQGADVILVHRVRLEIARLPILQLRLETAALLGRVIEF